MRKSYWSIIYWDVPTFLSFTCINLLGSLGYMIRSILSILYSNISRNILPASPLFLRLDGLFDEVCSECVRNTTVPIIA